MVVKEFPRLYTLDSKNKIRVFDCKVDNGDYTNQYAVITATGLLDGKLTEKLEIVKVGKQKRTVEQQAIFQATSLWNEKLDEGYKSAKSIMEKGGYIFDSNMSNEIHEKLIRSLLPNFPEASYTNKNWDELPMLAHKLKDIKNPKYPYLAQPKLDGVRCLVKEGAVNSNEIKLCSRGGQYYQIPHLEKSLFDLFNAIRLSGIRKDLILDGEIYKHGVPLQEISGAARREETGMFASNSWLEYHIYDIIGYPDCVSQEDRMISGLISINAFIEQNNISNVKVVQTSIIDNKSEVDQLHDEYVSQGYEGLILRTFEDKYEFNQRSKSLLKVKEYQDEEFQIIGCGYDENKATIGESFYFVLKNNKNDLTFKSRPTGTSEMKEHWFNNIGEYIGKKATVRFFARSNDGLPTQGVVRHKDTEVLVKHIRPDGE